MLKKAGSSVQQICRCLPIVVSSFYYRLEPKAIDANKVRLIAAMKHIHHEMDATYGKRPMLSELYAMGFELGIDRVRPWMKKLNLVAKRPRRHRYPKSGKPSLIAPNMLNRQFNPETVNRFWSGDTT